MTIDSYFEKQIKSAHTYLSRWVGTNAELWELTSSHKSLRILIRRDSTPGNLLLSCLDPVAIHAPINWTNCHLSIRSGTLMGRDELGFFITDEEAKVEICCGGLEVKENVKL